MIYFWEILHYQIQLFSASARGFEIFLIDPFASDIGNKSIVGNYLKNSCISVTHPILGGSVNTGCYIYNSLVVLLYYLSACNRDLFIKVTIAMFYFCYSKNPSNYYERYFFFHLYIFFQKKISL